MVHKNRKVFTLFLALFFGVFFLLLFLNKGVSLELIEANKANQNLQPQIYFKKSLKDHYSEKDSVFPHVISNNRYIFTLKNYNDIGYLRIDPHTKEANITIDSLMLIEKSWFSTSYYRLNLMDLKPLNQIKDFKKDRESFSFEATGNDPFLEMPFKLNRPIVIKSFHLDYLLISLIIALIGTFLYYLFSTQEISEKLTAKLIIYGLFFAFVAFKVNYYKEHIRFSYPPDELAHLSYISYVHNNHHFVPNYKEMTMINNKRRYNYLSHPPLYYEILNLSYDTSKTVKGNVDNFRTLSSLIFLLSFLIILFIAFRANLSIIADFVFLSLLSSVPMHAYIGASISNDTLAIFGVALFALGFIELLKKKYTFINYLFIALGVFIAYFSKLTAALLLFFAVVYYLIYSLIQKELPKISKGAWLLLIATLIPIVYYQVSIMLEYHAIVPTFNKTHPQEYLHSVFYVQPQYRQQLNLEQWFYRLLGFIEGGWFGIHSHHSFTKESWWGSFGLLVLHIFAIVALFLKCPKSQKSFCKLGKIAILALFTVLVIQFFFSYRAHLNSGYMGGLQPRYLLPFMFGFAIMASLLVERLKSNFLGVVLIIVISIHALYSDFFYFLQYYR